VKLLTSLESIAGKSDKHFEYFFQFSDTGFQGNGAVKATLMNLVNKTKQWFTKSTLVNPFTKPQLNSLRFNKRALEGSLRLVFNDIEQQKAYEIIRNELLPKNGGRRKATKPISKKQTTKPKATKKSPKKIAKQ
jgi:hypothetical protein